MKSNDEKIAALKLFNEKTQKLQSSSFVRDLQSPEAGVKIQVRRAADDSFTTSSKRTGPSEESIDSFVLTFRFFIQDNEDSSLRNIAKIYHETDFEDDLPGRFDSTRDAINDLLDSPNQFNITYNQNTPTNREVMEVFIYGGLAHANPKKYQQFNAWMSNQNIEKLFTACFSLILGNILNAISFIANLNKEAIEQLNDMKS